MSKVKTNILHNNQIEEREIIVLNKNGDFLGNMMTSAAIKIAQEQNVDLVCQSMNGDTPVCRLIELNKFLYERKKQQSVLQKNKSVTKDIQLKFGIHKHDLEIKLNQCVKFLNDKNQINVTIRIRNRDLKKDANVVTINETINNCKEFLEKYGNVVKIQLIQPPEKLIGSLVVSPKKV